MVVRTRDRVKPVFVSPGHMTDFEGAAQLVLDCCRGFRLPEPTRQADKAVARLKVAKGREADGGVSGRRS
jgi:deoxyribonuclease V